MWKYTLTCDVTSSVSISGTPTVQWVRPGSSAPIATGGDFTVSSTLPYTLIINPPMLDSTLAWQGLEMTLGQPQ